MESHLYFTYGLAGILKVKESKVIVICTKASSVLLKAILSCASASGIKPINIKTFVIDNESQDSFQHLLDNLYRSDAIIMVSTPLEVSININARARQAGVPSLFCNITQNDIVIFGDGGEVIEGLNVEGFTRLDSTEVSVGAINEDIGGTTVVTCNRSHGLLEGDVVSFGNPSNEKFCVVSVVSENGMSVLGKVRGIEPGERLCLVNRRDFRSKDDSLKDVVGEGRSDAFLPSPRADSMTCCLVAAGIVIQQLLTLITKRFPSENRLVWIPLCEEEQVTVLKDKCILVSGLDLVGDTLVRELVKANVGKVVLLDYGSTVGQFDIANCSHLTKTDLGRSKAEVLSCHHPSIISTRADLQDKDVCDALWGEADLVISCGGTFDERRTIDHWCVEHSKPLIDIAVDGMKGQVESIVPDKTTNYASSNDPTDNSEPPYCVLKSFPHVPEHSVIWAAEKIKHLLVDKPNVFNKFIEEHGGEEGGERLREGFGLPEGAVVFYKMCLSVFGKKKPAWKECVAFARLKFEKYFNHKAKQLVSSFPEDTLLTSGNQFWSWPKLTPRPVIFSVDNEVHVKFVVDLASFVAFMCGVDVPDSTLLASIIDQVGVPEFSPKNKTIVTDESVKAEEDVAGDSEELQMNVVVDMLDQVEAVKLNLESSPSIESLYSELLATTSMLRCDMYGIVRPTIPQIHKIKDNLQPCGAPMVFQACGRAVAEACRVLGQAPTATNWWMGVSSVVSATAPPPPLTHLSPSLSVTLWDKLEIKGDLTWTLQQFLDAVKQKYKVEVTMVVQDSRMVYVPFMPGHTARLPKLMTKLIKPPTAQLVKLSITAAVEGEEEDISLPPVKYYVK